MVGDSMEINNKLRKYIEENILPVYEKNDKAHRIDHIEYVTSRSLRFAQSVDGINIDMVYVIASYHDIAHHIDSSRHEELSAEYMMKDEELKKYFTSEELKTMYEAIVDHRASIEYTPRSVYGKIVSSADRNTDLLSPLKRTYEYRKSHSPHMTDMEIAEESRLHLIDKFGAKGYAKDKMYFPDPEYDKFLEELDSITQDKDRFYTAFCKANNIKR